MRRYRRIKRYRTLRQKKLIFKAAALSVIAIISVLLIDARIRPQIHALAYARSVSLAEGAVNGAVTRLLTSCGTSYNDLVTIDKRSDGQITAINTDAIKINLLKAQISEAVAASLAEYHSYELRIPSGMLTGLDYLAGSGPDIKVKVSLSGYALCNISNEFVSGGINQTIHRMYLTINAGVYILLPGNNDYTTVSTEFCIAETVIVGCVPDAYVNIGE